MISAFTLLETEVKELHDSLKRSDGVDLIGKLPTVPNELAEGPAEKWAKKPKLSWERVEVVFESKGHS